MQYIIPDRGPRVVPMVFSWFKPVVVNIMLCGLNKSVRASLLLDATEQIDPIHRIQNSISAGNVSKSFRRIYIYNR